MVTHQTASLMAAKPCGWSDVLACSSRSTVSCIAAMVHPSAPASTGGSPTCWRFQATRQRAEQNRACSRGGANEAPHCSHWRISVITLSPGPMLRVTAALSPAFGAPCAVSGVHDEEDEYGIGPGVVPEGGDVRVLGRGPVVLAAGAASRLAGPSGTAVPDSGQESDPHDPSA